MLFKNKQDWHLSNAMADAVKQVLESEILFCLLPLHKCHRYCTLSLKSLGTVLPPSSAICPNKRVLSEFSWAITRPLTLATVALSCLASRLPFLLFPAQRMIQQSEYHAATLERSARRIRVSQQGNAWHNLFAVYLRRPLYLLSACASSCSFFCAIRTEGRFGCCQWLEPLPLHFVCVALQHLGFMRLQTIKQVQR